jgi:hypothetical protein
MFDVGHVSMTLNQFQALAGHLSTVLLESPHASVLRLQAPILRRETIERMVYFVRR